MVIGYIFPRFGMLYLEKSGNPGYSKRLSTFVTLYMYLDVYLKLASRKHSQEPILRLLNLQLQRQRSSRLEHFSKKKKTFFLKRAGLLVAS
jgi:hypothetical protein